MLCVVASVRDASAEGERGPEPASAAPLDPANSRMFSADERDVIAASVPWTRLLTPEVLDDVRIRRESLVLKPNDEYGGKGVKSRLGSR